MKKILLLILLCLVGFQSQADQLAYISKEDAMKGAEIIKKAKVIYSYCGCCDDAKPIKLKVDQIIVRATGYEDYYEVYVVVKGKEIPVDLAYVWLKQDKVYQTVGEVAGLDHDPCKRFPK